MVSFALGLLGNGWVHWYQTNILLTYSCLRHVKFNLVLCACCGFSQVQWSLPFPVMLFIWNISISSGTNFTGMMHLMDEETSFNYCENLSSHYETHLKIPELWYLYSYFQAPERLYRSITNHVASEVSMIFDWIPLIIRHRLELTRGTWMFRWRRFGRGQRTFCRWTFCAPSTRAKVECWTLSRVEYRRLSTKRWPLDRRLWPTAAPF